MSPDTHTVELQSSPTLARMCKALQGRAQLPVASAGRILRYMYRSALLIRKPIFLGPYSMALWQSRGATGGSYERGIPVQVYLGYDKNTPARVSAGRCCVNLRKVRAKLVGLCFLTSGTPRKAETPRTRSVFVFLERTKVVGRSPLNNQASTSKRPLLSQHPGSCASLSMCRTCTGGALLIRTGSHENEEFLGRFSHLFLGTCYRPFLENVLISKDVPPTVFPAFLKSKSNGPRSLTGVPRS